MQKTKGGLHHIQSEKNCGSEALYLVRNSNPLEGFPQIHMDQYTKIIKDFWFPMPLG